MIRHNPLCLFVYSWGCFTQTMMELISEHP